MKRVKIKIKSNKVVPMTTHKLHYVTPHIETVELKPEGVICQSLGDPTDYSNGGNPFTF